MGGRTTLWIGIGLAVVTAALLGWNSYRLEQAQRAEAFLRLSPKLTIGQGMSVPPDGIETVYLPESARALASAAIADTAENREWLRDRRASRDIEAGSLLLYQFFADDPGQRFSAAITKGMRAVSISVDPASAVSYLVEPGSRVDIVGLFEESQLPSNDKAAREAITRGLTTARTVLQNVRILAVGGATSRGAYAVEESGAGLGTVTLELSPEQAETLVFAQGMLTNSQLILSLRNPADDEIRTLPARPWPAAVSGGAASP